jgi:hypothetical protein
VSSGRVSVAGTNGRKGGLIGAEVAIGLESLPWECVGWLGWECISGHVRGGVVRTFKSLGRKVI